MRPLLLLLLVPLVALTACVPEPVTWDDTLTRAAGAIADTQRIGFEPTSGRPLLVADWTPATWPSEPGLCATSVRATPALDSQAFASWFQVRPDSSVLLRVARSDDGGRSWNAASTADSTDVGRTGCERPAPFISADSINGYVHVVYHLVGKEGAGIFFTHTMDRGAMWHAVVPIVYGDRPSAASVASNGDTVAVAFEDPNSRFPRLGLALSFTQGHIFEARTSASDETGEARTPRVALRGDRITLAWTETQRGAGAPRVVYRQGTLQF
jgi:hypothetical protein